MLDIERIISTLRADSGNLDFTGFVTNAYVVDGALRGEVWKHIRADIFGRFADGHRIETSQIIDVEARENSVWFETESGSRYGILSFTPFGMINLTKLRDADGFPVWPPTEKIYLPSKKIKGKPSPLSEVLTKHANRLKLNPKKDIRCGRKKTQRLYSDTKRALKKT